MPADRALLISKPNAAGNGYDAYCLELAKNGVNYDLRASTNVSAVDQRLIYASWNPSLATWYHVAYTRNSTTGQQTLYVNGTQVAQATNTSGASNDSTHALYLGRFGSATALNLNGQLDEMRIWGVVRTQTQITNNKSLHLTTTSLADTTLKACYSFIADYGTWSYLFDSSTFANNLTNNGSATVTADVPFQEGLWSGTTAPDESTTFKDTINEVEQTLVGGTTFFVKIILVTTLETITSSEPYLKLRKLFTTISKSALGVWRNQSKS